MDEGMIHLYTGDGKGKTTAAFGLALRASGYGMRTYVGQFLKGKLYGEVKATKPNPLITVEQFGSEECLSKENVTEDDYNRARIGLQKCDIALQSSSYHMVVMDEVCVAIAFGLLDIDVVLNVVLRKPKAVELVLTGRYADKKLIAVANLVTEMQEVKHYYKEGLEARKGIEF